MRSPHTKGAPMKKTLGIAFLIAALALAGVALAQTRGVTPTEIVLGMHTDLSGPAATYGVSSSNAVKMRFDEVNDKGGIHGRKIRLIIEDTQYQVPRAVQAGAKLINRDRIFAMVAGLGTTMNNALFKGVPSPATMAKMRSRLISLAPAWTASGTWYWVSSTMSLILRPWMPPLSFTSSKRIFTAFEEETP